MHSCALSLFGKAAVGLEALNRIFSSKMKQSHCNCSERDKYLLK